MRGLLLAVLLLAVPLGVATPDPDASEWNAFVGTATQGSRDEWWMWLDAMYDGGVMCTMAVEELLFVLTVVEGSATDLLLLEGGYEHSPGATVATVHAPGVLYAENPDGCPRFSVEGVSVAGEARYRVDVYRVPWAFWPSGAPP